MIFKEQKDRCKTLFQKIGNLSEWLRRKIRNLLGFARAGSSPAVVVIFFKCESLIKRECLAYY